MGNRLTIYVISKHKGEDRIKRLMGEKNIHIFDGNQALGKYDEFGGDNINLKQGFDAAFIDQGYLMGAGMHPVIFPKLDKIIQSSGKKSLRFYLHGTDDDPAKLGSYHDDFRTEYEDDYGIEEEDILTFAHGVHSPAWEEVSQKIDELIAVPSKASPPKDQSSRIDTKPDKHQKKKILKKRDQLLDALTAQILMADMELKPADSQELKDKVAELMDKKKPPYPNPTEKFEKEFNTVWKNLLGYFDPKKPEHIQTFITNVDKIMEGE